MNDYGAAISPFLSIISESRGRTLLATGSTQLNEDEIWQDLKEAAEALKAVDGAPERGYTYKAATLDDDGPWPDFLFDAIPGPAVNSNLVIASVARSALGIDIEELLPDPWSIEQIPILPFSYFFGGAYYPGVHTWLGSEDGETQSLTQK